MNDLAKIFTKTAFSILLVLTVTACGGGDDKGVPPTDKKPDPTTPPNPTTPPLVGTVLSGVVMIGPVINADVTVSEITLDKSNSPIKLKLITLNTTSQQTNDKGEYTLSIKPVADNTPILVCATGGTYTEPASVALITPVEKTFQSQAQLCPTDLLCEEEKLCAVAIVKRDEKLTVNLTYFSHLAYGLAESRLLKGATLLDVSRNNSNGSTSLVLGGISNANVIMSGWLQLTTTGNSVNKGVISVTPQDITITPATNSTATLTNEIKYGLANAAISDLVEWMRLTSSTTQTVPAFDKVSTVALAQQVFKDIIDGDMDGKQNATSLFLSDTAIIGHMLRYHFAFKLFVVASNRRINQTGLNNSDIDSFVKSLNKYGIFFTSTPQVTIVNTKPVLSHVYPNDNGIINGDVSIKIDATDISDISSIAMTIDTVPPGGNPLLPTDVLAANPEKPEWSITTVSEVTPATPGIPDGVYDIKFVATNTQGVSTTRLMPNIRISNKDIHLHIVNPPIVSTTVGPKNPINSLAGFTSIVNDVFFMENSNNSSVKFSIVSTDPQSTLAPITVPLAVTPFNEISPISRRYFASDLSNANPVIIPDGIYKLVVDATSGKNVIPLLTASNNVEFEYDTQRPNANFSNATPDFTVFTGIATINLDVKDQQKNGYASGIKTTALWHDALGGGKVSTTVVGNQSVISFTEEGWHKLTLDAMDNAGNAAKTKTLNVAYDTKAPIVQIINKDNVRMIWQSKLDITAQIDDNESGIFKIFSDLILSSNTTAVPTTAHFTGDITNAPNIKTNLAFTDKDLQLDNNGAPIVDGIYKYAISASDFTNVSSHTVVSEVRNIGIDTTPPLITFTKENILNTPFSSTAVWKDVTGNAAISFDSANTTATMNWSFNAIVEEKNYIAHSTPTTIAGLSSGIAAVAVDNLTENVLSSDAAIYSINNKAKLVTVTNLPQYTIESTAAVTEVWNVIATCPQPTANGIRSLDAAGKKCVEIVANVEQPRSTVYNWIQVSSIVGTPAPAAVALPANAIISNNNPIAITAMDKSLVPNQPGLSGNQSKSFSCLNFRVSNITTPPQITSQIIIDSGVSANLLTAGVSTQDPTVAPIVCNEATINSTSPPWNNTPLIPVLDSTIAGLPPTTAITCTINATSKGTTIPAATTSTYKVEMQLSPQKSVDPASTKPLICPAVI